MNKTHLFAAACATIPGPVFAHADFTPPGKGGLLVTVRASNVFCDAKPAINVAGTLASRRAVLRSIP